MSGSRAPSVRAYVSFAANRRVFNQWQSAIPSRFLGELPPAHLDQATDAGLYATASAGHYGGMRDAATQFAVTLDGYSALPRRMRERTFDDLRAAGESSAATFAVGERVFHQKFGYGRVVAIDGPKLDIEFEKAGPKKVLDSFVQPA